MTTTAEAHAAVEKVRQLLYRRLKVTLTGGRVLVGDFACLDKQGNLILSNTNEFIDNGSSKPTERQMGMVLVPKAQQADVHMQVTLAEKASMLSLVSSQ
eukprot:jgi/Chrzof1/10744/Cz05g10240.t1